MSYNGPGWYKHYKGGEYEVLGIAFDEATMQPFVVYRPLERVMPSDLPKVAMKNRKDLESPAFWLRSLEIFDQTVTLRPRPINAPAVAPRFKYLGPMP